MELAQEPISTSAVLNLERIKERYTENELLIIRDLCHTDSNCGAFIVYLTILVDEKRLNQQIIRKINVDLLQYSGPVEKTILTSLYSLGDVKVLLDMDEVVSHIADANFVIFIEGNAEVYAMNLPGYETRAIEEPQLELNVRGPREGFTEDLQKNLGMVFRRMKSSNLKAKMYNLGQESQTKVMILYLANRADTEVLKEISRRIESIHLNALVDSTQIEELIQDSNFSPFPQILNTERPDRVITAVNRGKIVIMTDGTPNALIAPSTFFEMLHPSEDLYERFYFANFMRFIRIITLLISLFGPSLYIALTTFHLEMIPTPLMMTFLSAKAGIPFPTFIEALIMEVSFEALREASLRLPRVVGQSVSIVGALIIGEAAVQSGIVSRPMVIVVAMTGIASFTVPSFSTAISLRILRFPLMFLAALSGMFGLSVGMFLIIFHLCSLRSCGVLFLDPLGSKGWKYILKKVFLLPVNYRNASQHAVVLVDSSKSQSDYFPRKEWD
ncbi:MULTISPECIES: spore germination protein [unclassified Paenibacillus]|uniref:spore germination protein n=1 Tax=unclassified Paenibacillus TaxID=185978 RepID=UPI00070D9084|nr:MULTISPECIES: spore germination protein [unclassified Paenibacillus]KQX51218.1 hypothetical protein ASD40_35595 [Paenibacillus sp. Root444D2]KRE44249.1 hypothetical protein ASG85_32920 [Paenibacillus sp. Soil724D2]